MEIGISTLCLGPKPLTVDGLEHLRKSGFTRIELHANRPAFDFHDKPLVRGIARWFADNALPSPSLHLPFEEGFSPGELQSLSILDVDPLQRRRTLDEIKRCLEVADHAPVDGVVLHLGVPNQSFHPVAFDYTYAAVAMIQAFSGARVLIENLNNEIARVSRVQEFIAITQLDNVGLCYDSGHGQIGGDRDLNLSPQTAAIHLNDNDGRSDQHLWPFEGTADWPMFVEKLIMSKFEGPLILEGRDESLQIAQECRLRLKDLVDEARNSIEEFRLKYKLPARNPKEE